MKYHSSEFPISWVRDRHLEGNLELQKPMLQRRLVWKLRQKSNLVASALIGYPIPEIFIQQSTTAEGKTTFVVVDGQQRIAALLAFLGLKEDDPDNEFELRHLEKGTDDSLRNLSWNDMTPERRASFFDTILSFRVLQETNFEQVKDIFRRFNKFTVKLSDQELRNATYSGPFIKFVETLATDDLWAEHRIVTAEDIRRMRDIEYTSELVIGLIHGPQGGSAKAIDDFYSSYEEFQDEIPDQSATRRRFGRALDTIMTLYPEIKGSRWRNKTDFYTLFVAVGRLLDTKRLPEENIEKLRGALQEFSDQIAIRLSDEKAETPDHVVQYVRAVEKGVSDKARRGERHQAMLEVIDPYFVNRKGS